MLLLEIVKPETAAPSERKQFSEAGGTIGRLPDSDWVVADPYISGRHARIHYRDGQYLLEDLSTNGVFVNSRGNRLAKGQQYVLRHGDRVFLDRLEIKTAIVHSHAMTLPLAGPPDAVADALMPEGYESLRYLDTK